MSHDIGIPWTESKTRVIIWNSESDIDFSMSNRCGFYLWFELWTQKRKLHIDCLKLFRDPHNAVSPTHLTDKKSSRSPAKV